MEDMAERSKEMAEGMVRIANRGRRAAARLYERLEYLQQRLEEDKAEAARLRERFNVVAEKCRSLVDEYLTMIGAPLATKLATEREVAGVVDIANKPATFNGRRTVAS